jgi:hypothetical protein
MGEMGDESTLSACLCTTKPRRDGLAHEHAQAHKVF